MIKIIDIKSYDVSSFLDNILNSKLSNEILFDNSYIKITIENDNPINYIYRLFYEQCYLRRNNKKYISKCNIDNPNIHEIIISVGEAISYIKTIVPPVYGPIINDMIKNVNMICKNLTDLLMDESSSTLQYQISKFTQSIGYQQFETINTYDVDRIDIIRSKITSNPVVDLLAYDCEFGDLYNDSLDQEETYHLQVAYNFYNEKEAFNFIKILNDRRFDNISIINVYSISERGFFIEFYVDGYTSMIDETLQLLIHSTYGALIQK